MKRPFFIILILLFAAAGTLPAQESGETGNIDLEAWNTSRLDLQKTGMFVLGSWALANFGLSGFMMTRTTGRPYFVHQMNVFWNVVNAGIATFGLISAYRGMPLLTEPEILAEYGKFTRTLLINAGLDVLYITAGILLRLKGGEAKTQGTRLEGYGVSLILQGGFLLLFDAVLAVINSTLAARPPLL